MKDLADARILLVDDTKANLDMLVEGLKSDHKLSLALNGEMALEIAKRTPPDLVLLDIMMPGLDGYEVCQRLRKMPETAEVPIMFLSSLEEVKNKTRGFEVGGNDYLTKPFELLEVKARVRSLLKAKAYSDDVKERVTAELRVAREIQQSLFPKKPLKIPGFEVIGWCKPSTETGGDYYDWCELSPKEGLVVLGDATGHGLGSALLIASCRAYVRADLPKDQDLAGFMNRLNARIAEDMDGSRLVTFVSAIMDDGTGELKIISAGHCPALLSRASTAGTVEQIKAHGMPLGMTLGPGFKDSTTVRLQKGDRLVVYTDGITEAKSADGVMFGTERLSQAVIRHSKLEGQTFVDALYREAMDFSGNAALLDDLTLLSVRRL